MNNLQRFLAEDRPVNNLWNQDNEGDVSHFCDPGNSFKVDDEHYEEGYPVFGYSISIAKEGSDYDKLYVYYDIRDE